MFFLNVISWQMPQVFGSLVKLVFLSLLLLSVQRSSQFTRRLLQESHAVDNRCTIISRYPALYGSNTLKYYLFCVGVSPIDGLVLMWNIPTELSSAQSQSRFCLSESLPRAIIFLIVKLRRGFSQLSFVYVLFALNIFLITYFCIVSSYEPPLHHNTLPPRNG